MRKNILKTNAFRRNLRLRASGEGVIYGTFYSRPSSLRCAMDKASLQPWHLGDLTSTHHSGVGERERCQLV